MRNIKKMQTANKGDRSLFESIMAPEVIAALRDFSHAMDGGVLVGGIALSYYVKPRYTEDVGILYLSASLIPASVVGFKRNRLHSFEHLRTGAEIEVLTPEYIGISAEMTRQVVETAVEQHGMKVASPSGLVALKLARLNARGRADIIDLIKHCSIDLTGFYIPQEQLAKYIGLVQDAEDDPE